MNFIRGTRYFPIIFSTNDSGVLNWWIGVSYALHTNMRRNTGGGISVGRGFLILTLTDQKLNTRSSTESDIVGVQDCIPDLFWTRYFMESQVYQVMVTLFTKKTRAPFSWMRMGIHQVSSAPITSKLISYSSLTISLRSN